MTAIGLNTHSQARTQVSASVALLVLFAAGYYLYADLPLSPQLRLPAAGTVIGGWGLLVWHLGRLRVGDLLFAGAVVAITLASLLLNPAFYEDAGLRRFTGDYATSYLVFLSAYRWHWVRSPGFGRLRRLAITACSSA